MSQLDLFTPVRVYRDETASCTRCGKDIIVQHREAALVVSEYRGAEGECWTCAQRRAKSKTDATSTLGAETRQTAPGGDWVNADGSDMLSNLQPLYWLNNRRKSDNPPLSSLALDFLRMVGKK